MKNVKRFSIVLLFAIFLITGTMVNSAAAVELTSSISLPWKTEYVVNDRDTSAVALAVDPGTQKTMAAFHDNDADVMTFAKHVGAGLGDCGPGNTWDCWTGYTTTVGLLDGDYWIDPTGANSLAGYVYYESVGKSLVYQFMYNNGGGGTTLMKFNSVNNWNIGSKPSITFDKNGNPHVVVMINTSNSHTLLAYMHYTGNTADTSCTGPWQGSPRWKCEIIIDGVVVVDDPSITVTDFNSPRIAYRNPEGHALMYAYKTNLIPLNACPGNTNWRCTVVDSDSSTGYFPSIAYGGGKLYIAYFSGGYLRLAEYVGSGGNCAGSASWKCITIDDIADSLVEVDLSLVMDGDQPVIAYQDKDDGPQPKIKLAQTAFRAGLVAGNCGPENPFSTWYCQVIDQGTYSLGKDLDLMIGPTGLLNLAYLEDNINVAEQHIKLTYQYHGVFMPLITR